VYLSTARKLSAQDAPPTAWARAHDASSVTNSTRVSWLGAWSPLRPIADIARGELRAPAGVGLLDAPPPLRGAFILAGAPGSLARDLVPHAQGDSAHFAELAIQRAGESGSYHRPLDVVQGAATQLSGFGWSAVGSRAIAIGRFVVDQESEDTSSFTQRVSPSWTSPFVATDSVRPPMVRTRARVEGALGFRLGEYGVGLSVGLDSREHNSLDFPLRRTGRWATPAAMGGVERTLPWLNARVGAYARWSESAETNVLNPSPLNTSIYSVQGLDEPPGIQVVNATLFVRNDRRATANGLTASLDLLGTAVVLVYERGERAEDQYRLITSRSRPTDRWRTSASESRMQVQRAIGAHLRANVVAYHIGLDGTGSRADLNGVAVIDRHTQDAIEGEARYAVNAWTAAAMGGFVRRTMDRQDYVAELRTTLQQHTPFVGAEVARRLSSIDVAAGASMAWWSPTAALPPADRGPNYRRLIAPTLSYEASQGSATAFWLAARYSLRGHVIRIQARSERAAPTTVLTSRLQPSGDRQRWQLQFAYLM
jgi:hypothetical protein